MLVLIVLVERHFWGVGGLGWVDNLCVFFTIFITGIGLFIKVKIIDDCINIFIES